MRYSIEELKEVLKNSLSERRYNHSVMVMEESKNYIKAYKPNDKKFYEETIRAALMHDMAKEMGKEAEKKYIEDNNIDLDITNPINNALVHGIIGADRCLKEYDFNEQMSEAIRWHTTGNVNMSLMDKIVFLADKTGRNDLSPEMQEVRKQAFIDLDSAIYLYISGNIERLKQKNLPINELSYNAKKYFEKNK